MSPRTYIAKDIKPNQTWRFGTDKDGNILAIMVDVEVNFGEFGRQETENIWTQFELKEREAIQRVFDSAAKSLRKLILDEVDVVE